MKTVLYFRLQWRLCQRYTSGVYRYAKKAGWLMQPIDAGRNTPTARQAIKGWRADGCIVDWLFMDRMGWSPDVFGDLPTVFIDVSRMEQYRLCPSVDHDAVGCVRMAMAELLALGYEDNAYVGMIADRELQGRNRLTAEDVKYLAGTLGIRSDLDLRSIKETADLAESPLGQEVVFVQNQSACYTGIFRDDGKKAMAANFWHSKHSRRKP